MAGLQPPRITEKLVPVFTGQELTGWIMPVRAAASRSGAIIAVFRAAGIRLAELAGLPDDPGDPRRSDIDIGQRGITVRGKGRIVRIGHQAARRPGLVHPRPVPERAGRAAAAGRGQPGAADRRRHLPADHSAAAGSAALTPTRTGSDTTSAIPGCTAVARRAT
jgi:hypothetical protein